MAIGPNLSEINQLESGLGGVAERRARSVPGLYFAGAGTHPGAGLPGVVNSAKATARLALEDFGR